ncbi:mucin-2-like [Branchiostoma lanceolatum]|uniref:mucin-2-like n=1 Tax=Branchiostoma lanceolatum TaxID=7740 RepID=UPI0034562043
MAEAPADEVQHTQTANSQIAADLIDPDPGGTRTIPSPRTDPGGTRTIPSPRTDPGGTRTIPSPRTDPGGTRTIPSPRTDPGGTRTIPSPRTDPGGAVSSSQTARCKKSGCVPVFYEILSGRSADDSPSADGQGQGQDAAQARGSEDGQPSGPTTHTYEDGDTFGMRLGPPLNQDARSAPTVPSTPVPGRSTDGAQPVAAATHVYEDGESFGMRLGPALNSDVLNAPLVPSTPRPERPTGGVQQGPAGPNPLLNPQAVLSQLRPNPMYNSNQPPGSAQESRTVWGQLRHRLSRRQLICAAISSVTLVTLLIVVPVLLTHLHSRPGDQDSPATTTAGPNTTGRAAWQSSAVLMRTDEVTSADVTKVSPVHSRCPSHGITAAGPTPINTSVSTNTQETSDQGSREHVITFGDESGAGKLRSARGVAVSPDSMIWVADRSTAHLHVYSMEGVYLHQFPQDAPGLGHPSKRPSDVSIDKDGHLWVLMIGYPASPDSVVQVRRDGHLKANFDLPGVPRRALRGMAVDLCNNHVFVTRSDGYRGGMQAFNPDGKLQLGVGPQQQMRSPMNVAVNGEGNIFVSDSFTHSIYKYDETG